MNSHLIELLILAGIAVFMIIRLRNALGTRDGFEVEKETPAEQKRHTFEVIDGDVDRDISDNADPQSDTGKALLKMKALEPHFSVEKFLGGARGAYEMILMSFEKGQMDDIRPFLSQDVADAFQSVVDARADQGLTVEAEFIGVREIGLVSADLDDATNTASVDVKFIGELTSAVRNEDGEIIEGDTTTIKRQKDIWTFSRVMGTDDPNWILTATGE